MSRSCYLQHCQAWVSVPLLENIQHIVLYLSVDIPSVIQSIKDCFAEPPSNLNGTLLSPLPPPNK